MISLERAGIASVSSDAINKAFGRRLQDLRRQHRLSQSDLGDLLHLSRVTVANMESGKQNIQLHQIFSIAFAFDVQVERLIPTLSEIERVDGSSDRVRSDLLTPADVLFLKLAQVQLTAITEGANEDQARN